VRDAGYILRSGVLNVAIRLYNVSCKPNTVQYTNADVGDDGFTFKKSVLIDGVRSCTANREQY
jgi:hypothetical protein